MSSVYPIRRWGASKALAVLTIFAFLTVVPVSAHAAEPAAAGGGVLPFAVPAPGITSSVINVQVRGDASVADPDVQDPLEGVQLRLYESFLGTIGDPIPDDWALCESDEDGDCSFTVPNTGLLGENALEQFWVVHEDSPDDWFAVNTLRTGVTPNSGPSTIVSTPYRFLTPPMVANTTYTSGEDFMNADSPNTNTASSGLWQQSRNNPEVPDVCGLQIALVLDLSSSIDPGELEELKSAGEGFVDALEGTPSAVAVYTFATTAPAGGGAANGTLGLTSVATSDGADEVRAKINGLIGSQGFTNWDRGLLQVAQSSEEYDAVVFVTDGNPTAYGAGVLSPNARTRFNEIERGIFSANAVKAEGTRIYGVGILGEGAVGDPDVASANLQAVSGTGLEDDYFLVEDFDSLGENLEDLALEACVGTVNVIKQVIPAGGTIDDAAPAAGWTFSATSTAPVSPTSATTGDDGAVSFSVDLGADPSAPVTVTETLQDGFGLVQQSGANAVCTRLDTGADVPVTNDGALGFTVDTFVESGVTCQVFNQAAAALPGGISIVKTPSSTSVQAGTAVTYTYAVTNTGEVPLSDVTVVDDKCAPVSFVSGDTDDDGQLDLTETWTYTCTATITQTTTNTATATGETPDGDTVEDTDTATVTVPTVPPTGGIAIVKTPSSTSVQAGTAVTYTYAVTNTGEVPLSDVTVVDDKCSPVSFVSGDTDGDGQLDLTETWTFRCTATITQTTTNTATATGETPDGDTVEDTDTATVTVQVRPPAGGIAIEKTPSSTSVQAGTAVTYTYAVTNTGEVALSDVTVVDDKCSPVSFVSGDTDDDGQLGVTETWTFTCTATITQTTTNTATATGETPDGDTVEDTDTATVTVPAVPVTPPAAGIAIEKTASRTSVQAGTAVTFTYAVTNTGEVPLSSVEVVDDKCSPVSFASGDADGDKLLDVTETWTFKCTSTITQTTTNTATATGVTPDGDTVRHSDTAKVTVQSVPVTGGPAWTMSVLLSGLALMAFGAMLRLMRRRQLGA